jgi:hypothetical protein
MNSFWTMLYLELKILQIVNIVFTFFTNFLIQMWLWFIKCSKLCMKEGHQQINFFERM